MSNIYNLAKGRTSSKVTAPPGGHSSITFGDDSTPLPPSRFATPTKAAAPEPVPEAEPVETAPFEMPEPVLEGLSVDSLKLQAIGAIATARDEDEVKAALTVLIKV